MIIGIWWWYQHFSFVRLQLFSFGLAAKHAKHIQILRKVWNLEHKWNHSSPNLQLQLQALLPTAVIRTMDMILPRMAVLLMLHNTEARQITIRFRINKMWIDISKGSLRPCSVELQLSWLCSFDFAWVLACAILGVSEGYHHHCCHHGGKQSKLSRSLTTALTSLLSRFCYCYTQAKAKTNPQIPIPAWRALLSH